MYSYAPQDTYISVITKNLLSTKKKKKKKKKCLQGQTDKSLRNSLIKYCNIWKYSKNLDETVHTMK